MPLISFVMLGLVLDRRATTPDPRIHVNLSGRMLSAGTPLTISRSHRLGCFGLSACEPTTPSVTMISQHLLWRTVIRLQPVLHASVVRARARMASTFGIGAVVTQGGRARRTGAADR